MGRVPRSLTTHIDSSKAVGQRLHEARVRAGLSQRQLSFPGCTAAYISRIEAGARVPSLQMINHLAARLGVTGQWLATGVEAAAVVPADLIDAEVALRLGELEDAEKLFRAHLQDGDPDRPAALAGLGQIAYRRERPREAIKLLDEALRARNRRALADPGAVDTLGRCYALTGSLDTAIALFRDALDEARAAKASLEELRFGVLLANALIDTGDLGAAQSALADVIRIAEETGDPVAIARIYWSQSRLHGMRHEAELASRYARRALEILERTENDTYVAMAYHLLAYSEVEEGHEEDALRLLTRGRELFAQHMGKREDAKFATVEARALVSLGRSREAAGKASHALELVDSLSPGDRGLTYVALAEIFTAAGDRDRAQMLLGQALDLLADYGSKLALEAARPLADLLEENGDPAAALAVLRRATDAVPVGG
jgi:tetratricopeptide (TPR) repeat protein